MILRRPFIELGGLLPIDGAWEDDGLVALATVRIDGDLIAPLVVMRFGHGAVTVHFGVGLPECTLPRQLRNPETCERVLALVVEAVLARESSR